MIQWFLHARNECNGVHWSLDSTAYVAKKHSRHDGYSSSDAFRDLCGSLQVDDGKYDIICILFSEINRIGVKSNDIKTIKRKLQNCCTKSDVNVYCLDVFGKSLEAVADIVREKNRVDKEIVEKYDNKNPGKMGRCSEEDLERINSITRSAHMIHNEMMREGVLPPMLAQGVRYGREFIKEITESTLNRCTEKVKKLIDAIQKDEFDTLCAAEELSSLCKVTYMTEYHLATTRSSPNSSIESASAHIEEVAIWQGSLIQAFSNLKKSAKAV